MSERWTTAEFDAAVKGTELAKKTIDACRRVLVDGDRGKDVASELDISESQISRTIGKLKIRRDEQSMRSTIRSSIDGPELLAELRSFEQVKKSSKDLVILKARELLGSDIAVRDAEPGKFYSGKGVFKSPLHLVQSVGFGGVVVHETAKLERVPNITESFSLTITYPRDGGMAKVEEKVPGKERGDRVR